MDAQQLRALAERVMAATGPDRELDWLIRQATFDAHKEAAEQAHPDDTPEQRECYLSHLLEFGPSQVWFEKFTASLDAAMTLYMSIPERVPSDPRKATAEAPLQRAAGEALGISQRSVWSAVKAAKAAQIEGEGR